MKVMLIQNRFSLGVFGYLFCVVFFLGVMFDGYIFLFGIVVSMSVWLMYYNIEIFLDLDKFDFICWIDLDVDVVYVREKCFVFFG